MENIQKKKIISILILFLVLVIYHLLSHLFNFRIPCIFYEITGLYCPGCGVTRMFFSIINLDFYQAFRYNPLVFIILTLYIIYLIIKIIAKLLFKKNLKIPQVILNIIIILLILYGILRNIDLFSFLKPTKL